VRNVEGGTKRAREARGWWTPSVDVAKGKGTPRKVLVVGRRRAGGDSRTLEGSEAHERMNPERK
jgi:hypothetical protein